MLMDEAIIIYTLCLLSKTCECGHNHCEGGGEGVSIRTNLKKSSHRYWLLGTAVPALHILMDGARSV